MTDSQIPVEGIEIFQADVDFTTRTIRETVRSARDLLGRGGTDVEVVLTLVRFATSQSVIGFDINSATLYATAILMLAKGDSCND